MAIDEGPFQNITGIESLPYAFSAVRRGAASRFIQIWFDGNQNAALSSTDRLRAYSGASLIVDEPGGASFQTFSLLGDRCGTLILVPGGTKTLGVTAAASGGAQTFGAITRIELLSGGSVIYAVSSLTECANILTPGSYRTRYQLPA